MNFDTRYLILLVSTPFLVLLFHLLVARSVARIKPDFSPFLVAVFAVLLGYIAIGSISWKVSLQYMTVEVERFWAVVYGALVYSGLAFSYFQFFGMSETARRIHILYELKLNKAMAPSEICARYGKHDVLSLRLARLIAWGQLEVVDGRYVLKGWFLWWVARIIASWARLLGFTKDMLK